MLIKAEILGSEHKIWIPCDAVSDEVDAKVSEIISRTGGMTETPVTGIWVDAEGDTVQEDVHLLSFISSSTTAGNSDESISSMVVDLARILLEEGQEAVLVSDGGKCVLFSGEIEEVHKEINFTWRK